MTFISLDRHVEIAVIGRPHGVGGKMHVFLHNPNSTILDNFKVVLLKTDSGVSAYHISQVQPGSRCKLVRFDEIGSREAAEALRGARVWVPRDELPQLDEDEFYVADLIGIEACEDGRVLGTVTASRDQGGVEVIVITGGKEVLEVPLVDDYVASLDVRGGQIVLKDTASLPRTRIAPRGGRGGSSV